MTAAGAQWVREPVQQRDGTVAVFNDLYGNQWDLIGPNSCDALGIRGDLPLDLPRFTPVRCIVVCIAFAKGISMNRLVSALCVSAALAGTATVFSTACSAAVAVTFNKPDQYADLPFMTRERDDVLKTLKQHFEKLGATLPAGQDFSVDVLDIDLAGRLEPSKMASGMELRVLRGSADWPMIKLRYRIEAGGKSLKAGEARLADLNYLGHMNRYPTSESLRYEKAMLDDWFKKEILAAK